MAAQAACLMQSMGLSVTIRPFEKLQFGVHPKEQDWLDADSTYSGWLKKHSLHSVFFIHHCPYDQVVQTRQFGARSVYIVMWERFVDFEKSARLVDLLIAPTMSCYRFLRQLGYGDKTFYVPWVVEDYGVEPSPPHNPVRLFYSQGMPEPRRRGDAAFMAMATALGSGMDLTITVSYLDHLLPRDKIFLDRLPPNRVQVYANPSRAEHLELMKQSDLFLWPTTREGLGLLGLESIELGVPVVAFDVAPLNEYLADGVNARLVQGQSSQFRPGVPEFVMDHKAFLRYSQCLQEAVTRLSRLKQQVHYGWGVRKHKFLQAWLQLSRKLELDFCAV